MSWIRVSDDFAASRTVVPNVVDVVSGDSAATLCRAKARLEHVHQVARARSAFAPWWQPWARCRAARTVGPPRRVLRCHLRRGHLLSEHVMPDGHDVRFFARSS